MGASRLRKVLIPVAAWAALLALPDTAWAFRCGNKLVVDGDTAEMVLARCGQPAERTQYTALRPPVIWYGGRPVRVAGGPIEVLVETWTFNFGRQKLMQRVRLEAGIVVEVQALGYGHP
jgi:hypothetical protein